MTAPVSLGLVGLGAMGRNLGWRLAELGIPLAVHSYDHGETHRFLEALDAPVPAATDPVDLVQRLTPPRTILLMVTAGDAVDRVIEDLLPALRPGDLVIDGGNSHFRDTIRRGERLRELGIGYAGAGISGGETGARHGASIMVGADAGDYARARPVFDALAARVGSSVCAAHVGTDGAGHFVKMVHNGIEYALMQLIAEAWRAMQDVLGWDRQRQQDAFARLARGAAASYLMDITSEILCVPDPESGGYLLDRVSDRAAQKGTGRWTVEAALELGVAVPVIAAALSERMVSADPRRGTGAPAARAQPAGTTGGIGDDATVALQMLEDALHAGFLASFAQGFALLQAASTAYDWQLDLAEIARIWQGGCIIRAELLRDVEAAFRGDPALESLLQTGVFQSRLAAADPNWRAFVARNLSAGVTAPCASAALAWYDSLCAGRLPTNLIQAQRDYFGAHGFERTDRAGRFHDAWKRP
ncbi:MAG: NADP-dependent phosphogluconate dehydrogenase [Pseudomonadales bacterium]